MFISCVRLAFVTNADVKPEFWYIYRIQNNLLLANVPYVLECCLNPRQL